MTTSTVKRVVLGDAMSDRLYFAQVREDARAELAALRPTIADRVVVVSSGGCTALSLLAAGAGEVTAVDRNATQNHMVELKVAAATLGGREALAFLGAVETASRAATYRELRGLLSDGARRYWDTRETAVRTGVLGAGVSESFIATVVAALRLVVHPRSRIDRLLGCTTLDEQRELFGREWNTRRWRALFALLCNRLAFRQSYPAAFFANVENPSFAAHFRGLAEHAITDLQVQDNYFLHHMLTGHYPADVTGGVPGYLTEYGAARVVTGRERLTLVDGGMTEHLRRCPQHSIDCFALSNICEWMSPIEIDALFVQVLRTAAPGARVVYRNFVGWTELPRWCDRIVPDDALGDRLSHADRSVVQRRVVACTIAEAA